MGTPISWDEAGDIFPDLERSGLGLGGDEAFFHLAVSFLATRSEPFRVQLAGQDNCRGSSCAARHGLSARRIKLAPPAPSASC